MSARQHNPEMEKACLGAALIDGAAARLVAESLSSSDFNSDQNRAVFTAIHTLVGRGEPVDRLTLYRELGRNGSTELVGPTYLLDLEAATPTAANIKAHIRIVQECAVRRRLADLGARLHEAAGAEEADIGELVVQHQASLDGIRHAHGPRQNRAPLVRAGEIHADPVSYCIEQVLPQGMLTILSGKDKRGKTLLALEMVRAFLHQKPFVDTFTVQGSGPVAAYLLDDPDSLTVDRLVRLGIYEHPDLYLATASKVDLTDAQAVLTDMAAEVRRVGARLVLVDALYLFVPPGKDAGNDGSRMRPVMLALNKLAEDSGAPVLLIAHDNKSGADVAGSYVIRAQAKAILRLDLPKRSGEADAEDDDAPQTPRRVLRMETKLAPAQAWTLEIRGTPDDYRGWRYLGTTSQARTSEVLEAVEGFFDKGGYGTAEEIAKAIKRRREDVEAGLTTLEERGTVIHGAGAPGAGIAEAPKPRRGRRAKVYRKAEPTMDFPSRSPMPRGENRDGNSRALVGVDL